MIVFQGPSLLTQTRKYEEEDDLKDKDYLLDEEEYRTQNNNEYDDDKNDDEYCRQTLKHLQHFCIAFVGFTYMARANFVYSFLNLINQYVFVM